MHGRVTFSLFRLGMVLAAVSVLAACTKGGQFDPTTLLDNDMFDNKKPVKGQREPVFPAGVPGISTGIPEDLYKGYQPPPDQAADTGSAATPILPPSEQPAGPDATAAAKPKPKPKTKVARKPAHPRTRISVGLNKRPAEPTQSASQGGQTAWPAPSSAGQGQAQSSQSVWPSPASDSQAQSSQSVWPASPSGGGTQQAAQPSQSVWPNPPPTGTQ
jgi:hypothetical protein